MIKILVIFLATAAAQLADVATDPFPTWYFCLEGDK